MLVYRKGEIRTVAVKAYRADGETPDIDSQEIEIREFPFTEDDIVYPSTGREACSRTANQVYYQVDTTDDWAEIHGRYRIYFFITFNNPSDTLIEPIDFLIVN